MVIRKWNPFKDLINLHDDLGRMFEADLNSRAGHDLQVSRGAWSPKVDFFDRGEAAVLRAELPGLEQEDIELEVQDRRLLLAGERRFTREVKEEQYHRVERSYGRFCRSFTLPYEVDREKVAATYRNGVLEVVLPRSERVESRRIVVEGE
ncbi:MAG: hypothetical protein A2V67_18935 [Deltaproteobacteria bacterium RBG_13_61_14]|nr:MAG: hypothetical protein A2V67_18935 [Deltaproteobacteria bacterium RBG_13_61_14]